MTRAPSPLVARYRGKLAILDTNLLLLHWCASFEPALIGTFKRLNTFTVGDVTTLQSLLESFSVLCTTPHVLTEVSNLANSLKLRDKRDWASHLSEQIETVAEEWISAKEIATEPMFHLGITDACLCRLASKYVILTIDFPLSNYLETKKLNVINFNHLREMQYQ